VRDRRISFFLIAAVVCLLLVPPTPPEFRWVAEVTSAAYVVLAVLVGLESLSRRRSRVREDDA
jgi:negative regulator of sigma E activity